MKIILLQDVPTIGRKDDVKDVSPGFARNFLFPKRLAIPATEELIRKIDERKAREMRKKSDDHARHKDIADRLKKITLAFTMKSGGKGKAFGSITAAKIQEALAQQGIAVDKDWIMLDAPVKTSGEKIIPILFPQGLQSHVTINVQTTP